MNAPDFQLQDIYSETTHQLEEWKGTPLILTFWASWCPDSMKDLHYKHLFYEQMDKEVMGFLTINVTGREGKEEDAVQFLEKTGYSFPVLKDKGTQVYDAYQCMGVPTTFLLDENLEIRQSYSDKASFPEIVQGIHQLMNK
ncbi:peroxiredoxin [Sinobaca qinghaiensis]|uniref:Peroxiredoxin n=1 Tax=Sinobaca qinghaiensis TaxID=342944 RepID=A0A419V316_9BACL|nr:TlpA disulfide reductase family protein [Sinobaca qinghaiensis]RKD72801.1 peroxiredoxin [Sinobaca qinghaiensis]